MSGGPPLNYRPGVLVAEPGAEFAFPLTWVWLLQEALLNVGQFIAWRRSQVTPPPHFSRQLAQPTLALYELGEFTLAQN